MAVDAASPTCGPDPNNVMSTIVCDRLKANASALSRRQRVSAASECELLVTTQFLPLEPAPAVDSFTNPAGDRALGSRRSYVPSDQWDPAPLARPRRV